MSVQTTPLYEFNSEIVQLSQFKEQLLVSTLDKPVILDIKITVLDLHTSN